MGWVITKARGNESAREQEKREGEQERHKGRGSQDRKGSQNEDAEKGGEERFSTFLFTSMAALVVTNWVFHSQIIECKIKELKLLHLNTQSH